MKKLKKLEGLQNRTSNNLKLTYGGYDHTSNTNYKSGSGRGTTDSKVDGICEFL